MHSLKNLSFYLRAFNRKIVFVRLFGILSDSLTPGFQFSNLWNSDTNLYSNYWNGASCCSGWKWHFELRMWFGMSISTFTRYKDRSAASLFKEYRMESLRIECSTVYISKHRKYATRISTNRNISTKHHCVYGGRDLKIIGRSQQLDWHVIC